MTEARSQTPTYLLPGFSQTGGAWDRVVTTITSSGPIHQLEIPGFADFAGTAEALAREQKGVWAGYSQGGRLALHIAVHHPGQVEGLLLVSATPGIADPDDRAERRRHDLELAEWVERQTIEDFLDWWLAHPLFSQVDRQRDHRLTSTRQIADQLRRLGQGTQVPLWDRLAALEMPIVLVAGAVDEKYTAIAREMASAIGPNARLHVVPGAGHALLEEEPELIGELLLSL